MRSGIVWALVWLAAVSAAGPLRAEDAPRVAPQDAPQNVSQDAPKVCEVPNSLLTTESSLPNVEEAVKSGHPLDVLVIGSRSSTILGSEANAYPARLQASLKEKLPQTKVNVSQEIQPKKTAEETASGLVKLIEAKKPTLVIWQTGTVDALRSIDPDEFRNAVDEGIVALQKAGADVILMNPQYSPRTEMMISVPPYVDNMRAVAQQHDVPLFDRFAIMHQWNDQGDFDLFSTSPGIELARRVHDCLGQALSKFVVDAAHIGPAQQN
jgi:lysophospholipase L1-like esterase